MVIQAQFKHEAFEFSNSHVKSVSVISTGSAEVHREHFRGTHKPALWWIFVSRQRIVVPINVFIIEHRDGLVLFDTGLDRAILTDPDYYPDSVTSFFVHHIFKLHMRPEDTLTEQLKRAGYSAADVKKAVISHLHFDHIGGINEIPQADLYVSEREWEHMREPYSQRKGFYRQHIDIPGANWHRIAFEPTEDKSLSPFTHSYDLMGDGSLVLLSTPGHTPGSLSMLVRRDGAKPLLLVGDMAYGEKYFEHNQLPAIGDKKQLRASFEKVHALKRGLPGLVILPSHDAGATEELRIAV